MGETQIREYLDGVVLTAMSPDQWDDLEEELTLEEVTGAIYKKRSGKTPGPNGLLYCICHFLLAKSHVDLDSMRCSLFHFVASLFHFVLL